MGRGEEYGLNELHSSNVNVRILLFFYFNGQ